MIIVYQPCTIFTNFLVQHWSPLLLNIYIYQIIPGTTVHRYTSISDRGWLEMAVLLPVLFFLLFHSISGSYTYWSHDGNKHLWCPDNEECFSKATKMEMDHCCACFAKPIWELPFSNISYHSLAVEARDVQFKRTKIYNTTSYVKNSTVFRLSYINGYLKHFPENACDFNIVTIDVTKNMFHEIGNVSCFTNLDTLIMKDNLITLI